MTDTDATSSICPKGWKLPSYIGSDSFQNLVTTVYGVGNFSQIQETPLSFTPAGYYYGGTVYYVGTVGGYWSASATSTATDAYLLYFYSGGVRPQNSNYKVSGFSVRCVASR